MCNCGNIALAKKFFLFLILGIVILSVFAFFDVDILKFIIDKENKKLIFNIFIYICFILSLGVNYSYGQEVSELDREINTLERNSRLEKDKIERLEKENKKLKKDLRHCRKYYV